MADVQLARLRGAGLTGSAREGLLRQAEAALSRSLALAPAEGSAWAQLAELYFERNDYQRAVKALNLAASTGWSSRPVLLWRCRLALRYWRYLDANTQALFRREFSAAMRRSPRALARNAVRTESVEIVYESLASHPQLQQRFERMIGFHLRIGRKDSDQADADPVSGNRPTATAVRPAR